MELDKNCFYCMKDENLDKLMIEVCSLDISTLFLFREQTYRGRCVIALNKHEKEIFNLNKEEAALFINDVSRASKAIYNAFNRIKLIMPHLEIKCPICICTWCLNMRVRKAGVQLLK